jgi:hypothetical protein
LADDDEAAAERDLGARFLADPERGTSRWFEIDPLLSAPRGAAMIAATHLEERSLVALFRSPDAFWLDCFRA